MLAAPGWVSAGLVRNQTARLDFNSSLDPLGLMLQELLGSVLDFSFPFSSVWRLPRIILAIGIWSLRDEWLVPGGAAETFLCQWLQLMALAML